MIYETMRPLKTEKTEKLLRDTKVGWKILREIQNLTDSSSSDDVGMASDIKGFCEFHIDLDKI